MPLEIEYTNISPLYVWLLFIAYNWFQLNFNMYSLLNALIALDYRVVIIITNVVGIYLFLRYARIEFTFRIQMNNT